MRRPAQPLPTKNQPGALMVSRVNLISIWRQARLAHEPRAGIIQLMARSSIPEMGGRESQLAAELRLHARGPVLSTQPRLSVMCGAASPRLSIWAATGLRYF